MLQFNIHKPKQYLFGLAYQKYNICVFVVSVHCFRFWQKNKTLSIDASQLALPPLRPAREREKVNKKKFYYVSEIPDSRAQATIVGIIPVTGYLYRK